jgi:hypothetical protein
MSAPTAAPASDVAEEISRLSSRLMGEARIHCDAPRQQEHHGDDCRHNQKKPFHTLPPPSGFPGKKYQRTKG